MSRKSLISLALALCAFGATAPASQFDFRNLLTQAQVAELPPSARESYIQALRYADVILYREAADALIEAANRAPRSVEVNILAAEAAGRWGTLLSGDASREYYRTGIQILERIQHEEMGGTNRARVTDQLARQREALEAVGARDDARLATGFRLVQTIRRERLQRAVRDSDEGARVLLGRDRQATERGEEDFETRAGEIWPQFAAPGRYVPPRFNPNMQGGQFGQMGGFGMMGFDPMMMGGDPAMFGGQFGEGAFDGGGFGGGFGGGDPFATGGDPFATGGDPFGGGGQGGFGADPFGGGGQGGFGGDPFGGGGGMSPGQNPFVDGGQSGG